MIRWPLLFQSKEYSKMADQPARLEAATIKAEIGSGIVYRYANDAATEDDIPTLSGAIPNLKKEILRLQNEGAEKISFATKIFISTSAGIAGTSNQEIFLVQSNNPGEIYEVWQNVSGTAVDTGKRSISASAVIEATEAATAAAASAQESADAATIRVARFLEPSATPPTQRDDGQPLELGDRYLNTTDQIEYIYKSTGWVANNLDAQTLAQKDGASRIGAELSDGTATTVQGAINSLRQDLALPSGANKVGYLNGNVANALGRRASIEEGPYTIFDDGRDETEGLQQNIDAHIARGVKYIWLERMYNIKGMILKTEGVTLMAGNRNAGFYQLDAHTVAHNPSVWLPRSGCELHGVKFRYKVWDEVNMASLRSTRPEGGFSLRSCPVAVGYSEIWTSNNSQIPNTILGQTLGVVYNTGLHDLDILGAAVHGIKLQNSVSATVTNLKASQVKGTTIYGFIAPGTKVIGGSIVSTRDDAIYLGGSDGHMNGIWTPLKQSDMKDIRMSGIYCDKIGAKVYSASGYDGVTITDSSVGSCRTSVIFTAAESSQGVQASKNVVVDNVYATEAFGGFGSGADGFGYSTDVITAGSAAAFAVDLSGVNGFDIRNSRFVRTPKVPTLTQIRGGFGLMDGLKNGKVTNCKFVNFPKNNVGLENPTGALTATDNVLLEGNDFTDVTQGTDVRLVYVGPQATGIVSRRNFYKSDAVSSASRAAIIMGAGSRVTSENDSFRLTYGLPMFDISAGPGKFDLIEPLDLIAQYARPSSIGGVVRWGSSAPGTGTWKVGDVVHNSTPTQEKNISHWLCRTAGTPGQWSAVGAGFGTDAQRPTLTANDLGYIYKNTTSNAMQFWSGSAWV